MVGGGVWSKHHKSMLFNGPDEANGGTFLIKKVARSYGVFEDFVGDPKRIQKRCSATHILRICLCRFFTSFYCSQIFELILDHSDSPSNHWHQHFKFQRQYWWSCPLFIHFHPSSTLCFGFFRTKIYPFQPGMKSHSLAIVVPCRNQKLETFPTFRTPRFGRLGWAEQVVNAKGTAELFACHTVGLCGPSNPRCYLWNQSHSPPRKEIFLRSFQFWEMTNSKTTVYL